MTCSYCDEEILKHEPVGFNGSMHQECACRAIMGSAAHQMHICHCFGGRGEDPPEFTARQGAKLAWETFQALKKKREQASLN
ncbi:MAG TPA: hypothetical protein VK789_09375 [Bryobacteraceae bacterium]|jgi:hypothetical protein|nr:hypothetical protein [Bryobacteraceae bacterium]